MDHAHRPYWQQSRDVIGQCLTRVQADRVRAEPHSDLAVALDIAQEALADLLQVLGFELEETSGGDT
jgi:hypothetical protein